MPSIAAGLVVFFTSAAVLVLEILAGRLLAPYVGVTLQTYTGIIGTVLAGIALGSWYGGRLADRIDPRLLLGPMVILGGILALFTIPLITFFGAAMVGGGVLAILLLSFVGFFAPAAVLSAVTPTVVKLQLASLDETGEVVGRLSALGTAGALVGTFVTGFLLVAALPSRPIILGVGIALVLTGGGLWLWLAPHRDRTPAAMVVLALFAGTLTTATVIPCDIESAYYCANVEHDDARDSGRILRLDTLRHSYVDLEDPTHLEFSYTQVFGDVLDVVAPAGEPIRALHIGGGGFSMPRYIDATRPGSYNRVLELDPTLIQIAEEELGFVAGPDTDVVMGDARLGLRTEEQGTYDIVIGDAFGGLAVPWHLTTMEFVAQIEAVMVPGGIYVINVIDYPPLAFARAETATLQAVFPHVAVVAPSERLEGRTGGNVILVGSSAPLDEEGIAAAVQARGGTELVATGDRLERWVGAAEVLRDDFAPVDQLLTTPVR